MVTQRKARSTPNPEFSSNIEIDIATQVLRSIRTFIIHIIRFSWEEQGRPILMYRNGLIEQGETNGLVFYSD